MGRYRAGLNSVAAFRAGDIPVGLFFSFPFFSFFSLFASWKTESRSRTKQSSGCFTCTSLGALCPVKMKRNSGPVKIMARDTHENGVNSMPWSRLIHRSFDVLTLSSTTGGSLYAFNFIRAFEIFFSNFSFLFIFSFCSFDSFIELEFAREFRSLEKRILLPKIR